MKLLLGREDLLGLIAAQLEHKEASSELKLRKPIWVDVGGGTGYAETRTFPRQERN